MITRVPPRYCVDARIKSIRFWPMSVLESSTAPAVSVPMPPSPGSLMTASPELTLEQYLSEEQ